MAVFCSEWGLWWWRLSVSNVVVDALRTDALTLPTIDGWKQEWASRDIAMFRQPYITRGMPSFVPLDMLIQDNMVRRHRRDVRLHQWGGVVAWGSLCRAGGEDLVCSPEFCYLQICGEIRRLVSEKIDNRLYVVILAELGCELCGTYSKRDTSRGYTKRERPLLSSSTLLFYLGRMAFCYGARRMREALPWIIDGMASPMETALYLLICLPPSLGGLGIMRPISNAKINVPQELRVGVHAWRQIVMPDLFWPERGVVVEYDSDEAHAGREREDQERRELLQDMGYVVIVFHADDVLDRGKFSAKVSSLAGHLGLSLPPASDEFTRLQDTLRNMLLRHRRWV